MNALSFRSVRPEPSIPWFDDAAPAGTLCKVYNDGGCFIGIPSSRISKKTARRKKVPKPIDDSFREIYLKAMSENVGRSELFEYILSRLEELYPERTDLYTYTECNIHRTRHNIHARKKRFRRKAYLNSWNYFVSFTYDDQKSTEDVFRTKLRKCLSNLHTRHGWLYMGVFERAPETGRLHFHAIVYVPEGEMIGKIEERKDYSTKKHRMQITHTNSFFQDRFGRNDFESLSEGELRNGNTLNYLLKYLEKSEERIIYSRGIPTEIYREISDDDVAAEMVDYLCTKWVLFNDVIDIEELRRIQQHKHLKNTVPIPS